MRLICVWDMGHARNLMICSKLTPGQIELIFEYLYYILLRGTGYLRRGNSYGQARGTIGSGLTPGSPLGRRTWRNRTVPVLEPKKGSTSFASFLGQIRVKWHLNMQKKMSPDRNWTELEPNRNRLVPVRFSCSHVAPHFAWLNGALAKFGNKNGF